jgi:hypothetical protein
MVEKSLKTNNSEENKLIEKEFPKATVIRLMKSNLPSDVYISQSVKDGMNSFLYNILKDVCRELSKFPYTVIDLEMFKSATFSYKNIKTIDTERKTLISRLEAIESDIALMKRDINHRMKSVEND